MPCDTILSPEQTLAQRMAEIDASLRKLAANLASGAVKIGIGPGGGVTFTGWSATDRKGVTDVCAYRTLAHQNSSELRQAVARAEFMSGRKVNPTAIASGLHSHDGIHWSKH